MGCASSKEPSLESINPSAGTKTLLGRVASQKSQLSQEFGGDVAPGTSRANTIIPLSSKTPHTYENVYATVNDQESEMKPVNTTFQEEYRVELNQEISACNNPCANLMMKCQENYPPPRPNGEKCSATYQDVHYELNNILATSKITVDMLQKVKQNLIDICQILEEKEVECTQQARCLIQLQVDLDSLRAQHENCLSCVQQQNLGMDKWAQEQKCLISNNKALEQEKMKLSQCLKALQADNDEKKRQIDEILCRLDQSERRARELTLLRADQISCTDALGCRVKNSKRVPEPMPKNMDMDYNNQLVSKKEYVMNSKIGQNLPMGVINDDSDVLLLRNEVDRLKDRLVLLERCGNAFCTCIEEGRR